MDLSKGEGFDFFVEAAGVPELVMPETEKAMAINAKVVQIGRAAQRVPITWKPTRCAAASSLARRATRATPTFLT